MPNRAEFERRLADRLSAQPPEPFALMTVDVDQLRLRNHASGCPAGDAVLKQVADVLRTNLRPEDLAARWDGDEFLVLMPGLDEFAARAVVKRMWVALLMPDDPAAAIPVAFGTAAHPIHGTSAESLLAALERSRQLAKQPRAA